MKDILICTEIPFWNNQAGCDRRIIQTISDLKKEFNVSIFYIGYLSSKNKKAICTQYSIKIYSTYSLKNSSLSVIKSVINSYFPILRNILKSIRKIDTIQSYYNAKAYRELNKILNQNTFQSIMIEYIWLSYLVANYNGIKIIDTHDIQSERYDSYKNNGNNYNFKIDFDTEISILKTFNLVIAISNSDYDKLSKSLSNVAYIPYYNNPKYIKTKPNNTGFLNIAFIGSAIEFNIDAITWFIDNVFIHINKSFILNIYGNVSNYTKHSKIFNINSIGYIKDTEEIYENNCIIINPVRFGGGLKIKNIEALSHGKPLITTDIGSQGIELGKNKAFYLCNSDKEFIELFNNIMKNPSQLDLISINSIDFYNNFIKNISSFTNYINEL